MGMQELSTLGQSLDNQIQDLTDNVVLKNNIYDNRFCCLLPKWKDI